MDDWRYDYDWDPRTVCYGGGDNGTGECLKNQRGNNYKKIVLIDFEMDKKNIEMAWEILNNPNATFGQRLMALGWLGLVGIGTGSGIAGGLGLACVVSGPGCVAAVESAIGICADGDCTNEAQWVFDVGVKFVNNLDKAQKILRHGWEKLINGAGNWADNAMYYYNQLKPYLLQVVQDPNSTWDLTGNGAWRVLGEINGIRIAVTGKIIDGIFHVGNAWITK